MPGAEQTEVELPFIDQLVSMGWRHTTGNLHQPRATGRRSFRDVLLRDDLREALRRINLDDAGSPWLDADRVEQAVTALERLGATKLLEANQKATELLLRGTVVDGVEGWEQGRGRTVQFIDWDRPENNTFRAVNQLQIACPTGYADKVVIPDIVLFVNGIPLVVVEAKSPYLPSPLESAVDQLQRYANRRRELGLVTVNEGNEQLFHYAQFTVATCGEQARVGTISSLAVHYLAWKDTSPTPMAQLASERQKDVGALTQQEVLVAGMLRPAHLLDIVRNFTLFMEVGSRTVKVVCRYQQFRAVQLAVARLVAGKTRAEDGEHDRRGGIVWHTQGSGKSLTMVFLIRKMRTMAALRPFKIVVVTDRRDLEKQLAETAALTGEVLTRVKPETRGAKSVSSREVLQEVLSRPGKDLVFAMIQKYRGELLDSDDGAYEDEDQDTGEAEAKAPPRSAPLPVLNTSDKVLVLIDEAHRSHTNTAHANLMQALPNCAKIGFTGTPIIMRAKGQTAKIFGEFIDRYTLKEAEADGATVPILYEGRTSEAAVDGGGQLDEVFEDMLVARTPEQIEAIKQKYATKGHVTEAVALIRAKADNMLRHYVENILPNGFKAQVVAVSRRAAIRYHEALRAARDTLVSEVEGVSPLLLDLSDEEVAQLERRKQLLIRAHRFLPTLRALEFAPIISGGHNDTVDPTGEWSTQSKIDARIARFKKPLFAAGPNTFEGESADPLAFLIVKSMLLTGFDAPIEQVLYLDRHIKEAELLQAIARVNRTYAKGDVGKGVGIVVDYYGVARHLKEALAAYAAEDVDGALRSLKDEIPRLRDRHRRVVDLFLARDVDDIADTAACVDLLREEKLRATFHVQLKQFLTTLDLVLPRPEGLEFVNDAKTLAHIQARARNRYRGAENLIGKEVGEKVRRLIDEHIVSLGINPKIAPIEITASDFGKHVDAERSPRAKASEMEHALRHHIRKHLDEDPAHYEKLSARLQGILKEFAGRWEEMAEALRALVKEATAGRQRDDATGLDPETQAPFYDVLKQAVAGDAALDDARREKLCALTVELVDHIRQEIGVVGFWAKAQAKSALRSAIFVTLDDAALVDFAALDALSDRLLELAKANHHRLVRA
ncbi:MAG: type I restriction endonuclease subunit R [Deltaproteobacteria bacterium]|nr:type I restriction endonuclease subunit R [Deltaproteobacteria bacterium]